ncbi:hypothetical protein Agub_g2976 [Astrephomene gubernaculifera]|uniref:Uncharacterized protein n=1 Tax=Astrephomene gubernaculifera TaxID=47775 RepID=A0AAD3DKJ4_9CHLO|nr:hypothetical protein Agub_g2976 [Astrephomene gubernaculifera]
MKALMVMRAWPTLFLLGSSLWMASAVVRDMGNLQTYCEGDATLPVNCQVPDPLPYGDYAQFLVTVAPNATYDLVIAVDSKEGDVDIQLLAPNRSTVVASSSERIGADVVALKRTQLAAYPGNYVLSVQAVGTALSTYAIKIQTVTSQPRLAASEVALMASIAAQCCSPDDDLLPDSCNTLNAAVAANATADEDLCAQPPNMCNSEGHLTKLVLTGGDTGNFVCPSFPAELGQLAALQVLDWTGNGQVGSLSSVASVLAPLLGSSSSRGPLRRLYLGRNALSGPLGCELLAGGALEVLVLDSNLLTGTVPACMFTSSSLLQLSLSYNLLSGALPQLPAPFASSPGCPLMALYLAANGPPSGPSSSNPGFQGSLPASLINAPNLTYLDVSSNSLTGTIPPLPTKLQVFKASDNSLTGPLPPSLDVANDLRVLDLSSNQLTGSLPATLTDNPLLTVLRLASNHLSGPLPGGNWSSFLLGCDLSSNSLTGGSPEVVLLPSLIDLNLADNSLTLDMKAVSSRLPANSSLLYFNVSHNALTGELGSGLGGMRLFRQLLLQAVQDEALQGSMPPQPLFDISSNHINATFPLWMLPHLANLYLASPYDYIPLTLALQPQTVTGGGGLVCPATGATLPEGVAYLDDLQQLYDLTCLYNGVPTNISTYVNTAMAKIKPPQPPRPPPPSPPAPPPRPRKRPPPSPSPAPAKKPPPPGASSASSPSPSPSPSGGSPAPSPSSSPINNGNNSPAPGGAQQTQTDGTTKKSSSGMFAAVGGGAGGGALLLIVLLIVGVVLYRRRNTRRSAYESKRTPLTYNATFEAQSEGTASNYGELQMFEFRTNERPTRHRARLQ